MCDYKGKKILINKEEIVWKDIGDEIVFLNFNTNHYYSLNEVGVRVWELILEDKSYDEILNICLEEYDSAEPEIESGINDLLSDLVDEGFIEIK